MAKTLKEALSVDKRASNFASRSGGKVFGLCDIYLLSEYAIDEVKSCLEMPNMVGIGELQLNAPGFGVHDDPEFHLSKKSKVYERLVAILDLMKKTRKHSVIEIHFSNSTTGPKQEEALAVADLAAKYPEIDFVILHSGLMQMIDLDGLKTIGRRMASRQSPRNVWTDTSGGIMKDADISLQGLRSCKTLERQAELAAVWREFGIDRVLFGTDMTFGPAGYVDQAYVLLSRQVFFSNPFLSADEKAQIARGNFERMASRLRQMH